jgi:ribosome recycling factor
MIDQIKKEMNESMNSAVSSLKYQLSKVRTGRASASVLDGIKVDYYGTMTQLSQVGQVSTPEARLLQIQPFDRNMIAAIEKSILVANIGLTPSNDGNLIRIPFPALTEERRKEQVKEVKKLGEDSKISVRNIRRDNNDLVKKSEKNKELSEDESKKYQTDIQKVTDGFISQVDEIIIEKEKELLKV